MDVEIKVEYVYFLTQNSVDVAVLDLKMPHLDGINILSAILQKGIQILRLNRKTWPSTSAFLPAMSPKCLKKASVRLLRSDWILKYTQDLHVFSALILSKTGVFF